MSLTPSAADSAARAPLYDGLALPNVSITIHAGGPNSMSSVTGAPRPRALIVGLTDREVDVARSIAGSVKVVDNMNKAHPEEHDVLIVADAQFHSFQHAYPRRLVFGPEPADVIVRTLASSSVGGGTHVLTKMRTQGTPARDIEVTKDARALGIAGLVGRSCMPAAGDRYTGFRVPVYPEREVRPLLREVLKSPLTLAGILEKRNADGGLIDSAIWLPDIARSALGEWVSFAFGVWREDEPERFPASADWMVAAEWSSPEEVTARRDLKDFERAEAVRLELIDRERGALTASLESVRAEGDVWRSILTETGDELVAAVRTAFEFLGFAVLDADALPEHKGAKREDLRVNDGDWTALVEVKGYGGAAKSNDLGQVTRAAVIYAMSEQKEPDALWYVPNADRSTAPSSRGVALAGREDDLAAFADNHHGLLIDTRDLFALRQRVANGTTSPEEARQELKSATGRYSG